MSKQAQRPAPVVAPISDDEDWGANAADSDLKNIRYDAKLVRKFREMAVAKLHNIAGDPLGEEEAALVPVQEDEGFTCRWGAFLDRASNEKILRLALEELIKVVDDAPPGRTGVRAIDGRRGFRSLELLKKFDERWLSK